MLNNTQKLLSKNTKKHFNFCGLTRIEGYQHSTQRQNFKILPHNRFLKLTSMRLQWGIPQIAHITTSPLDGSYDRQLGQIYQASSTFMQFLRDYFFLLWLITPSCSLSLSLQVTDNYNIIVTRSSKDEKLILPPTYPYHQSSSLHGTFIASKHFPYALNGKNFMHSYTLQMVI